MLGLSYLLQCRCQFIVAFIFVSLICPGEVSSVTNSSSYASQFPVETKSWRLTLSGIRSVSSSSTNGSLSTISRTFPSYNSSVSSILDSSRITEHPRWPLNNDSTGITQLQSTNERTSYERNISTVLFNATRLVIPHTQSFFVSSTPMVELPSSSGIITSPIVSSKSSKIREDNWQSRITDVASSLGVSSVFTKNEQSSSAKSLNTYPSIINQSNMISVKGVAPTRISSKYTDSSSIDIEPDQERNKTAIANNNTSNITSSKITIHSTTIYHLHNETLKSVNVSSFDHSQFSSRTLVHETVATAISADFHTKVDEGVVSHTISVTSPKSPEMVIIGITSTSIKIQGTSEEEVPTQLKTSIQPSRKQETFSSISDHLLPSPMLTVSNASSVHTTILQKDSSTVAAITSSIPHNSSIEGVFKPPISHLLSSYSRSKKHFDENTLNVSQSDSLGSSTSNLQYNVTTSKVSSVPFVLRNPVAHNNASTMSTIQAATLVTSSSKRVMQNSYPFSVGVNIRPTSVVSKTTKRNSGEYTLQTSEPHESIRAKISSTTSEISEKRIPFSSLPITHATSVIMGSAVSTLSQTPNSWNSASSLVSQSVSSAHINITSLTVDKSNTAFSKENSYKIIHRGVMSSIPSSSFYISHSSIANAVSTVSPSPVISPSLSVISRSPLVESSRGLTPTAVHPDLSRMLSSEISSSKMVGFTVIPIIEPCYISYVITIPQKLPLSANSSAPVLHNISSPSSLRGTALHTNSQNRYNNFTLHPSQTSTVAQFNVASLSISGNLIQTKSLFSTQSDKQTSFPLIPSSNFHLSTTSLFNTPEVRVSHNASVAILTVKVSPSTPFNFQFTMTTLSVGKNMSETKQPDTMYQRSMTTLEPTPSSFSYSFAIRPSSEPPLHTTDLLSRAVESLSHHLASRPFPSDSRNNSNEGTATRMSVLEVPFQTQRARSIPSPVISSHTWMNTSSFNRMTLLKGNIVTTQSTIFQSAINGNQAILSTNVSSYRISSASRRDRPTTFAIEVSSLKSVSVLTYATPVISNISTSTQMKMLSEERTSAIPRLPTVLVSRSWSELTVFHSSTSTGSLPTPRTGKSTSVYLAMYNSSLTVLGDWQRSLVTTISATPTRDINESTTNYHSLSSEIIALQNVSTMNSPDIATTTLNEFFSKQNSTSANPVLSTLSVNTTRIAFFSSPYSVTERLRVPSLDGNISSSETSSQHVGQTDYITTLSLPEMFPSVAHAYPLSSSTISIKPWQYWSSVGPVVSDTTSFGGSIPPAQRLRRALQDVPQNSSKSSKETAHNGFGSSSATIIKPTKSSLLTLFVESTSTKPSENSLTSHNANIERSAFRSIVGGENSITLPAVTPSLGETLMKTNLYPSKTLFLSESKEVKMSPILRNSSYIAPSTPILYWSGKSSEDRAIENRTVSLGKSIAISSELHSSTFFQLKQSLTATPITTSTSMSFVKMKNNTLTPSIPAFRVTSPMVFKRISSSWSTESIPGKLGFYSSSKSSDVRGKAHETVSFVKVITNSSKSYTSSSPSFSETEQSLTAIPFTSSNIMSSVKTQDNTTTGIQGFLITRPVVSSSVSSILARSVSNPGKSSFYSSRKSSEVRAMSTRIISSPITHSANIQDNKTTGFLVPSTLVSTSVSSSLIRSESIPGKSSLYSSSMSSEVRAISNDTDSLEKVTMNSSGSYSPTFSKFNQSLTATPIISSSIPLSANMQDDKTTGIQEFLVTTSLFSMNTSYSSATMTITSSIPLDTIQSRISRNGFPNATSLTIVSQISRMVSKSAVFVSSSLGVEISSPANAISQSFNPPTLVNTSRTMIPPSHVPLSEESSMANSTVITKSNLPISETELLSNSSQTYQILSTEYGNEPSPTDSISIPTPVIVQTAGFTHIMESLTQTSSEDVATTHSTIAWKIATVSPSPSSTLTSVEKGQLRPTPSLSSVSGDVSSYKISEIRNSSKTPSSSGKSPISESAKRPISQSEVISSAINSSVQLSTYFSVTTSAVKRTISFVKSLLSYHLIHVPTSSLGLCTVGYSTVYLSNVTGVVSASTASTLHRNTTMGSLSPVLSSKAAHASFVDSITTVHSPVHSPAHSPVHSPVISTMLIRTSSVIMQNKSSSFVVNTTSHPTVTLHLNLSSSTTFQTKYASSVIHRMNLSTVVNPSVNRTRSIDASERVQGSTTIHELTVTQLHSSFSTPTLITSLKVQQASTSSIRTSPLLTASASVSTIVTSSIRTSPLLTASASVSTTVTSSIRTSPLLTASASVSTIVSYNVKPSVSPISISSSPSSYFSVSSSSSVVVTSPPTVPPTETANSLLLIVLAVPVMENVTGNQFKRDIEFKLNEVYQKGLSVQKKRRKRSTRMDTSVKVENIKREGGERVDVKYIVINNNKTMPAEDAAKTMNVFTVQKLTEFLGYNVLLRPEPVAKGFTSDDIVAMLIKTNSQKNMSSPLVKKYFENELANFYVGKISLGSIVNASITYTYFEPFQRTYIEFAITVDNVIVNRSAVVQVFNVTTNVLTTSLKQVVIVAPYIPGLLNPTAQDYIIQSMVYTGGDSVQAKKELSTKLSQVYLAAKQKVPRKRRKRALGSIDSVITHISPRKDSEVDVTYYIIDGGSILNATYACSILNRLSTKEMTSITKPSVVTKAPSPLHPSTSKTSAGDDYPSWMIPVIIAGSVALLLLLILIILYCRWKKGAPAKKIQPAVGSPTEEQRDAPRITHAADPEEKRDLRRPPPAPLQTAVLIEENDARSSSAGRSPVRKVPVRENSVRRKVSSRERLITSQLTRTNPAFVEDSDDESVIDESVPQNNRQQTKPQVVTKKPIPLPRKRQSPPPVEETLESEEESETEVSDGESIYTKDSVFTGNTDQHSAAALPTVAVMSATRAPQQQPPVRFRTSVHPEPASLPPIDLKQTSLIGRVVEEEGPLVQEMNTKTDIERWRNKQRQREKKQGESQSKPGKRPSFTEKKAWSRAQHEIGSVLDPDAMQPIVRKKKRKPRRKYNMTTETTDDENNVKLRGFQKLTSPREEKRVEREQDSPSDSDISMSEARRRMIALLDDAFASMKPKRPDANDKVDGRTDRQRPMSYPTSGYRPPLHPRPAVSTPALLEPPPAHGRASAPSARHRRRFLNSQNSLPYPSPYYPGSDGRAAYPPPQPVVTKNPVVVWDPADKQRLLNQSSYRPYPGHPYTYSDPSRKLHFTPVQHTPDGMGGLVWSPYATEYAMEDFYRNVRMPETLDDKNATFLSQMQETPLAATPESMPVPHDTVIDMGGTSAITSEPGSMTGRSPEPLIRAIKDELFRLSNGRTPVKQL